MKGNAKFDSAGFFSLQIFWSLCPHLLQYSFVKYHSPFCVWGNYNTGFQWLVGADNKQASFGNSLKSLGESQSDLSRVGLEGLEAIWTLITMWQLESQWILTGVTGLCGRLGHSSQSSRAQTHRLRSLGIENPDDFICGDTTSWMWIWKVIDSLWFLIAFFFPLKKCNYMSMRVSICWYTYMWTQVLSEPRRMYQISWC